MKKFSLLFLVFLITLSTRAQVGLGPLTLNFSETADLSANFRGGIKCGTTITDLEQLTLNFNSQKSGLWKGGNLFLHVLNIHGNGPTQKLLGDLMYVSNIEAENYFAFYEFWISQKIGKITFLLGQHDLNTEFACSDNEADFINSSFGITPGISMNVPVSIYPVAAPCIFAKYETNAFSFKLASYEGNPGTIETNHNDLHWHLNSRNGLMNIAEAGFSPANMKKDSPFQGIYKVGFYFHTGTFCNYTDTSRLKTGNYGMYIIIDQPVRHFNYEKTLDIFAEVESAPDRFNFIGYSVETGILFRSKLYKNTNGTLGIGYSIAELSKYLPMNENNYASSETALELFSKINFGNHFTIQPEFQYIHHPGAIKNIPDANVGLIRAILKL